MVFRIASIMLEYGIINHLEDIKKLVQSIFEFAENNGFYSIRALQLMNLLIKLNHNYSLSVIVKNLNELTPSQVWSEKGVMDSVCDRVQQVDHQVMTKCLKAL